MSGLSVNLAGVESGLRDFPVGVYPARITKAELDVSKNTGQPMIVVWLEIHHPMLGSGTLRDWLVVTFPAKIKTFYQAVNNYTAQELAEAVNRNPDIELDPQELVGAELLVQIGEEPSQNDPSKLYKKVVSPFFYPVSRSDLLAWMEDDVPL